jgi:hypothetical protein
MNRPALLTALGLLAFPTLKAAAPVLSWSQLIANAGNGSTKHIARVNNGDIITASFVTGPSLAVQDVRVSRHNPATGATSGTGYWSVDINDGSGDDINDMVIDPATGDTFLAVRGTITGQGLNWYVHRVNGATGTVTWTYTFNNANANDECRSLALTSDGHVVVVGMMSAADNTPSSRVVKLNGTDGTVIWTATNATNWQDYFHVVAGSSGTSYAIATVQAVATEDNNCVITKFDSASGTPLWSTTYNGPTNGFDSFNTVLVDSNGDPVASGTVRNRSSTTDGNMNVVKFNASTGTKIWETAVAGAGNASDISAMITADGSGNIYLCGLERITSTDEVAMVCKLNSSGVVQWTHRKNGSFADGEERYRNIQIFGDSIYAAGHTTLSATPTRDYLITRLLLTDGSEVWSTTHDQFAADTLNGTKHHLAVDSVDTLYLGGDDSNQDTGILMKFGPSGPVGATVTSLNRVGATPTDSASVSWTLTFGTAVTGVTASNFSLTGAGATGASVGTPSTADSGVTWTIPVTTGADGVLTLNLANSTGLSSVSTSLPYTGQSYTIDKSPPLVQSVTRLSPAGQSTSLSTVTFRVTYSEPVTLNAPESGHFAVMPVNGSSIVGSVTGVTGTGTTRDVTVNVTSGSGEFRLRVLD